MIWAVCSTNSIAPTENEHSTAGKRISFPSFPYMNCMYSISSVQFSPWPIRSSVGHDRRFRSCFSPAGSSLEQFWHGQGCPLFDDVHPASLLPITAWPTLQGVQYDVFGEAVVACDMPERCKFPSLHSCQKRLLWTHKEVDLALHSVVGLVLQVGDAGELSSDTSHGHHRHQKEREEQQHQQYHHRHPQSPALFPLPQHRSRDRHFMIIS